MKILANLIFVTTAGLGLLSAISIQAQAPGVKIERDHGKDPSELVDKANELRTAGKLISFDTVMEQIGRKSCELNLPKPATQKLTDREIWQRSQEGHVRIGYLYMCKYCDKWHLNISGGYYITEDGAAGTCYHVIRAADANFREGYLVAFNEDGDIFPVTEVLAANPKTDIAIVRVKTNAPVKPLALNTNVTPGDGAWLFSDPLGRTGYFSKGIVNRFFDLPRKNGGTAPYMEVSTDWAAGSSGAAVLDECANAIGHVSEVENGKQPNRATTGQPSQAPNTVIVFHYASRAADVLALVKPVAKPEK